MCQKTNDWNVIVNNMSEFLGVQEARPKLVASTPLESIASTPKHPMTTSSSLTSLKAKTPSRKKKRRSQGALSVGDDLGKDTVPTCRQRGSGDASSSSASSAAAPVAADASDGASAKAAERPRIQVRPSYSLPEYRKVGETAELHGSRCLDSRRQSLIDFAGRHGAGGSPCKLHLRCVGLVGLKQKHPTAIIFLLQVLSDRESGGGVERVLSSSVERASSNDVASPDQAMMSPNYRALSPLSSPLSSSQGDHFPSSPATPNPQGQVMYIAVGATEIVDKAPSPTFNKFVRMDAMSSCQGRYILPLESLPVI